MRKLQRLLPILGAVLGLCLAGCSSTDNTPDSAAGGGGSGGSGGSSAGSGGTGSGDSGACKPFDYTNYMATTAPTLTKDVQPMVFQNSCALSSSCHQIGSQHPPVLGPSLFTLDGGKASTAQLQDIMTQLGKSSEQVPAKKFMVAGKPEDSYVVNKVDGTAACAGTCAVTPATLCAKNMPDGTLPLEAGQIKMLRDWIKTGAPL